MAKKKYQNSADLNAALNEAVERRKDQEKNLVDPKERWKAGQAQGQRRKSILALALLVPLSVLAIAWAAYMMGFRIGLPGALSDALASPAGATDLNLAATHLKELPVEIKTLTALRSLNLDNNEIGSLPGGIGDLKALEVLSVQYNKLSALPTELGYLEKLQTLAVKNNQIGALPETFSGLKGLKTLDLTNNKLTSLPKDFGKMKTLESVLLRGNNISNLPPGFSKLRNLRELDLKDNPISELPPPTSFPELRRLNVRGTKIPASTIESYKTRLKKVSVSK